MCTLAASSTARFAWAIRVPFHIHVTSKMSLSRQRLPEKRPNFAKSKTSLMLSVPSVENSKKRIKEPTEVRLPKKLTRLLHREEPTPKLQLKMVALL